MAEGLGQEPPKLDERLIAAELEKELAAAHLKEEPRIKARSKADIQKAKRMLIGQLEQLQVKRDPMEPVTLDDGSRFYGTKEAGIHFWVDKNGRQRVNLIRGSKSLKTDWKSVAGRLGALVPDPNDPNELAIAKVNVDQSLTTAQKTKRIEELRKVKQDKQRAPLDPVVFELAMMAYGTKESSVERIEIELPPGVVNSEATRETLGHMLCDSYSKEIELRLPDTLIAIFTMLSETEEHAFERRFDQFSRQIKAAWAIKHRVSNYQQCLIELTKLAQKLNRPPAKGELAGRLGHNAQRMSQLCEDLDYDWLPTEKPGPTPNRFKGRNRKA